MRTTLISTFAAILMVAAVFLAWAPQAKAAVATVPDSACCDPQLEQADCFCASKFGGWVREVPCTYDAVCSAECEIGVWECNIQPVKCKPWEKGKVLQRFIEFSEAEQKLNCNCDAGIICD